MIAVDVQLEYTIGVWAEFDYGINGNNLMTEEEFVIKTGCKKAKDAEILCNASQEEEYLIQLNLRSMQTGIIWHYFKRQLSIMWKNLNP